MTSKFNKPTYTNENRVVINTFSAMIPDGMRYFRAADDWRGKIEEDLCDKFEFIMVNDGYEGGFDQYHDASFSVHVVQAGTLEDSIDELWNKGSESVAEEFENVLITNLEANGCSDIDVHRVYPTERMVVVYADSKEAGENEPFWRQYTYLLAQNHVLYNGSIYFNCEEVDLYETDAAIEDWFKKLDSISEEEKTAYQIAVKKNIFGEFAAADGEIDAVKVAQLFSKDVFFNNDGEIAYDGYHQQMIGLQLNAPEVVKYPTIIKHLKEFGASVTSVVRYVEENDRLILPDSVVHENLLDLTQNHTITGISFFTFCEHHLISIFGEEDGYAVSVYTDFIKAIPNASDYIAEFIRTLRLYNGKTSDFEITFVGVRDLNETIGDIEPVANADDGIFNQKMTFAGIVG